MALMRSVNRLREIRLSKGLSGYDLQLLSDIDAKSIYAIERGLKHPSSFEKGALANALGHLEREIFPESMKYHSCPKSIFEMND
jgi:transcriptional regulator with XRE-family HTH domain